MITVVRNFINFRLIYSMEQEQSVAGTLNSSIAPVCSAIEAEIVSNTSEKSDISSGEQAKRVQG